MINIRFGCVAAEVGCEQMKFRTLPGIIGRAGSRGEIRHDYPRRAGGARFMPKGEFGGYFHE
jgi:hypothetical protein